MDPRLRALLNGILAKALRCGFCHPGESGGLSGISGEKMGPRFRDRR
jgi:hypothetical protein